MHETIASPLTAIILEYENDTDSDRCRQDHTACGVVSTVGQCMTCWLWVDS